MERIRDCLDKDMQQGLVMWLWSPPPGEESRQTARFHTAITLKFKLELGRKGS